MIEMVDKPGDLNNAIALNSSMVNAARIIGPAIAGILLKIMGVGYCFLFKAVSYIAIIVSLWVMVVGPTGRCAVTGPGCQY